MKKYLILLLTVSTTCLSGQVNFPKDTLEFVVNEGSDIQNEQNLYLKNNQASGDLNYDYHILLDEFKGTANWTVLFCDCENCIENYSDTGSCLGLKPKETWYFAVYITTTKAVKDKYFTMAFTNPNDSTDTDTVTLKTVVGNLLSTDNRVQRDLKLNITPNPAQDHVTVSFDTEAGTAYTLSIVNILGEEVMKKEITGEDYLVNRDFDVSDYESGLYFIHLKNGTQSRVQKLIIQ